jgi:acyl carrier protein
MKEKLIELFKEALEIDDRELSIEDKFREYPEWDSLGQLSLIAALDEKFGIVIENSAFESIDTINALRVKLEEISQKDI